MPLRPRFIGAHETMTTSKLKGAFATAAFVVGTLACKTAGAGGISLYEVGTADVGLASAGYSARAQDASTVFTNPAGMARLAGETSSRLAPRCFTETWASRSGKGPRRL